MNIDTDAVWVAVHQHRASSSPPQVVMESIIATCEASLPHADWDRLRAIDYEKGARHLAAWVRDRLSGLPPAQPAATAGLWCGLFNPVDDDQPTADLYLARSPAYDPDDSDYGWLFVCEHGPEPDRARSEVLNRIYRVAYDAEGGLGNDAEWSLCLAFAVVGLRHAFHGLTSADVSGGRAPIGVATGFDSGDLLNVGVLGPEGFRGFTSPP